ncbi:DNA cytosine methyltransferase [Segatella sp.]|uniref:DNA cytosine methyltransferase n=1 Tax=Segatella sp. TaxID=2974253 RepID=UPI00307A970F
MFDEQDRQYFYNEFKNNGYEVGSYDDFKKDLNNEEDRNWYYNEAKNMGYDVGTQADFDKMVLEPAPSTSGGGKQVDASSTTQSVEQKASTETKPQVAQPAKKQETTDKVPGLIAKVLDMIPTGVQTSNGTYQPSPEIPQPVVKGEEMPVKEETSSSSSANAASPESKEAAPVTTPTGVVNNEGLMDAKLANYIEDWKQRPDKQSTYFENLVADLLADGTANSNEEAVNMVMPALHRYANRSAMDVTNQVVSSLPDDTVQDAEKSIEAHWYSHGVQDKLKQEAYNMGISYDDYVGLFLKPAMVQSLVNKYGPKYRDIAEGIATRLYSHDENVQDRLMNQDINDALFSVISKYVNPSVVDEYNKAQEAGSKAFTEGMEGSQFIPANLRLGTALGAQYEANEAKDPAKVLSSLQKKFGRLYRNPEFLNDMSNAAFKVMQRYGLNGTQSSDPKQFKPMINSVLKNELDQLEIKGMMPKGSAEYIMKTGLGNTIVGKITRKAVQTDYQNWLEDIANQQYQPGFWENVASGALTFAGDAWSYWLPGAAGGKLTKSMVAKAEGKLAGDLMAKGMERKMAERAAKVLIGKSKAAALKSGAAHGAVTFGGQSAISKPIDEIYRTGQFDENGKIYNPSVGKVIANTLGEVAKQSAVGAIMQGGTIANMVGKGRGLATNILADIGGKVADSGIMTGHQMLERMAQDPNFKPTGKDAAESFLESMANLTAIGLPGMVGKYARFKDAREFNKKFDFTDQDIAELKRFGYDGLRDAFEKMGIGEYAVVGENAQRLDGQLTQKYMDLMNDKSVPEVLKAKMMAVVEGKRPSSFSPIVDSIIVQPMDNDGKVYLETLNKDGGVVERKEFASLDEAQKADKKLEYEKTLGLASVLETEFHNEFTQEHLDGLYNKAAQKYNMGEKLTDEDKAAVYLHQNAGAIKDIMDKQQKGIILTDEEQKQVNAYRHYYDSALENSSVMREFVNTFEDSHGVARGTLRKALESKENKYAPLVESYLKELYNSIELKREMKQIEDDKKRIEQGDVDGAKPATPVEEPASVEGSAGSQEPPVSEELAPYQDRTNSVPTPSDAEVAANPANSAAEGVGNEPKVASSDAFVMGQNAYKNGDSEALQAIDYNSDLATGRLKRAFADNEKMPDIVANAYNEGRDMEQFVAQRASSLTPAQKEAISKYVEAMDAKKGAIDALQHADDGYGEALKEQLWPYQTEDGNIVPATLDSGKQVFLKKANEYGGAFVVVPDDQGQPTIKQVSNAEIKEVGTPVSLDEYIENTVAQQKDARAQQFISQFDGSGLKPNDQVTVAMEEGDANVNMTFAGYSKDGKIVLTDGKDYLPLSKEEFAAWRKNALDNTINEHLDAEDDEREQKAASQAEADKKQRYANGIVGLSEGQPDYSSNDTDPNVAAEYLQEQFGEDHGKLLNLVNGSRDDIKTQLANKRKAAIEYQNWLDTNADLDPEKAKKVEDELSLVNEQIADLDARFKNWNTIRNSVMTPDEVKAMKEERKAEVEKAGVDESAIVPSDDFHVLVLEDEELKKQYPTMDEATDYITSQRKDIYHTQEDVERKINGVNDMLDQYINGETELDPTQLMELNTSKAQLEALQTNLSVAAKGLKAQANKLSKLYKTEVSQQEMEKLGMTPSEQRKALVTDALKKNDMKAIHEIYKDASVDVMDLTPQTLEEAVSESLLPHSLNPESLQYELGKSNFKFGIGKRYDSNKFNYLIAKKGTGMSVNEFAVRVYNDLPVNLLDMGYSDQDVRNVLLDMFKSYDSVKEMRNVALMNRIAAAEDELSSEEEYYEAQKEREIFERQAEIENYKSYIHEKELSLPSESELDHINGLEFDRMMEIEDREREYKQYVKSILPELADYDDRSNEEGYGGGSSLGSDSSRRGVDEGNSQGEEVGNGEASSESEIGEGSDSGRKGRQETGSMEPGEGSAVRGSHLPQEASFGERLKSAIAETETEPTEAQKKAGNYKKGHLSFGGYDYTVETPKGVTRSGKDEQGKPWSVTMHDTYGYILGKIGVDGDHIDMFINDAADLDTFDGNVYVVDQVNPETGEFDEHKVMYGYPSEEAATEAYLANYSKGWKGLGKVTAVPKATFDKWLESSDRKTKPFAEYAMVQKEQAKFDRDVKEVKPENLTEAQKVAYDAVSTMLKKAGIPVKVVSNEDMEKVAEAQDNLAVEMLLNDPRLRFYIKTPEQKEAAKAAYDWAAKNRPDKFKQYAIVNMDNPNQPPQYFEKKHLAEKWRKYYTNAWKIGNYKAFNLNKPFEEQIKDVKGDVPSEFDPYKAESLLNKRIELEKQIKETEDSYNAKKKERAEYQNQLMQDYMDQHGLSSENDIPDDVWTDYRDKSFEKYQDTLDDLFHKYVELDNQLKAVAEPGVQYLKGKGVVYGYTDGKQIVLNQEHLNPNTPIHEYQHLWRTAAKKMNPELIEHGDKLIMQTQLFADLKQDPNYNHLTDEQICDEAFARLTGEDGAVILEQMAKDAIKENPLDTAKELSVINKLKEWLKKFWYWTLDTFTKWKPEDIKKMTLEDIRNLVLRDLANGVDPRTKLHEAENADDIKFMGSTTKKRMKNVASQFEGRELDKAQQVVADVYSGKDNNKDFSFTSGGAERIMVMRQGNDDHAGTKHSLYRHFGVNKNYITVDDILSLPKMLNVSTRKPSKKGTIEYSYTDKESGVTYTVVTKPVGNKEHFQNFYSDRKANPSDASHVTEGNTYTPEGARKTDGNAFMRAKVDNNSETAKGNDENLSVEDKIKAVSQQFGVDEADVAMYANAIKKGSTSEAARARVNIKRHLLQANEDKISSFKELLKYTVPVNEALKENFGDVDAMIEEHKQQMEAQRNAMEAARKRAEEEEAKRQKHLEELSVIPDDQLDKQYMDALAKGDDATAREMLDEAARRKGYDDTESSYQGVGAWAAPGNPGYESDKARRDDWESSGSDVNLEDIALGYTPQPDDYFSHPERYSQNTPHGLESVKAINTAIDAIKNGEKDVKVKVYRAVPTSVKEGKLRNGDWVTPSKKYAEMHGTNRLEGKYRIIEDEVPANQLWWDGNDANEFGFDDGKAYKYKNAKNNRKLNDLVTYDDEGDVIPPSKRFNSRKQDVRFHRVTEPEELDRLNKEKTFRMYSGMQEVDGKLYSPMAAIIDGKRTDATEIGAWMGADERPDLVKNGKFQLVKTDKNPGAGEGPVPAAYNPYMHTSTSVMNDQFSGAYARGNIKVVEWEIPESEKTSGYHAEGAKDSVGLVPWTSGTVNSLLPKDRQRSVMLSRWRKAVRIVPDEEVAEKIAAQLSGTGLAIPWNVVTPNQLRELAKLGVPITTVEQGRQNPEVKEKFLEQMDELKKEFPQAQFVDVKMTKDAFKEWGGKGIVKSPIMEQKLKKHPDSLMKAGTYFSGGGLVEEGLKGIIDPVVAVEYDRKISGVYRNNFGQHIVTADVRDVDPKELVKHIDGEVEYFHASPVCKNYSQAKSNSGEVELDKETAKSTADFIDAVKPRVVTIENVKGYKDSEAMNIITKSLDKNGYTWDSDVYNAADYGGYTSRERLIIRAVKDGELPEKPKKQPRKGGWLEAVEDILPTLTVKESGVAPWMDARLKADGIDWQKVEKPLYVMGSAYADGKIPHAYGDEILPTLRTKSGDVIIMPGGKVLRADGRVLARITGLGDDYKLPKTESLAHTIIGNGIPVQLTQGVIAPLLNKDDLSGRNVLARLGSSIFKNNWDADKQKQVSDRVVNTANKLGGAEATVYTSVDEVPDAYLSDVKNGATGWYDPTTHTVHVYLPNCADANEAERTVLHEKIGHEGMEVLLGGEDGVRKFANFVYRSVGKDVRGKIIDFANKYDPDWKNPDRMNVGTQEYIAHLAEEGPKTAEDFSLWTKIKHYLIKLLKKLGVSVPGLLNDKDLRYYLMKAGKALHVWDEMPETQQEAMMKQASNAEIKDALSDGAGKGKPRQKKGESTIQYMKRVQEWRKWQNAREDKENPEPPMFYDIDKDEAGKKEWAQLNKDWRERHHLVGEEPTGMPIRMENEEDDAYMNRIHEYEKWQAAMKDQNDPLPDMFAFEKKKQNEVKRKYEDWLAKHDLLEQQQADLDLYEGKIYPAETNPKADALEQQVMQDLAEVTSTDVSKEGAAMTVKHAVIHRRKNMEEASADDAIYINDVKNRIEKMADSGVFDKLLSDYKGKPNRAEKLAEAIPYIIEAPRRLRDLAHDLNATGAFDKGHIHIQPTDVEAIQPFVADLIAQTGKRHTELKDGKEVEVYDDPQAVGEVASKMAQAINANHQGEEGFVPIDGSDILSEHVLPLVKQQIVPEGIDYKNLSPEMKAAIDSIRDWYNYTYDWLKDNHTLREDTGYNADYVNHIWDKEKSDKQAYAMYVENRQRTKSPNEKPRTISTLMEGISVGLVPKTTDITKMMAYYSRSNIEAWVNKTMLQELSGLNVIERNEDGEVVSTDPLLSSSAPFNLEQYQYFEIPGVGPVWVYNVSPKQVKVKNPITGKEKVLYSEASAGDRFGVVFETYQSSPFWKAFDTLASSAKKLELGFSGFHAGALTEVYMVQNMVEFGPKKAMANFMKYIFADTAKNHELPCFANPEDFQEAASHLVKFGATNDYAAADVQNMFDNMRDAMIKVQKKLKDGNKISGTVAVATMPLKVVTQMLSLINKGMDVALWDFLHDGLKLATYRMRADKTKERAKKKGWSAEELNRALDEDGQFVNDMFGGQHWDVLGASHRTLRYAGRVLLSPDWNASTTRHFLALTGFGSIWNEATFENFKQYYKRLKHKELTPEDEGRRSRQISALLCYGIGFMVFYEGIANGINAAFRALDEEKERKKAEEIRKTNPSYKSMYELAYGDEGMKWYDYLMRGNSLGQQSKIFLGRYEDGTEMYVRHGKQFREVPEYLFNHKGELEFPGPMVQRMIGKANPMVRMTLDDINYLSDFQASHADQDIQRKYGKTIGLLYKDALYWAPFLIPSQENKEFKAVDFFFPSSKGFSPWKAQSYFKDFILSGDMEGVVMTYQSCQRNGIDPEAQIKAAIGSVKALESAEMSDGVTSLLEASKRFDAAKSITEKKKMRQKMKKFLSQSDYKAFTQKEALDIVQGYLNGDEDLKEMEKAESKYLMKAKAEDVTEDWRIQNVWNGTMQTYQEYQRLKDVDKAKANAFKNSKTNKRLFAARKAISAARRKMNKAKKQMDGTNDAAKLVEIRNTRKELLKTLNGME